MADRIRKNQALLSDEEWNAFVNAVKAIKGSEAQSPTYDEIVEAHKMARHQMQAHNFPYFLAWHREFLLKFEDRLRQEDENVTIPYWNWTRNRTIPPRLGNPAEWGVTRISQINDPLPGFLGQSVSRAMEQTEYFLFHRTINGPHGTVHVEIGGEMGDIENSPRDVVFWLHHSFLDKLWDDWQIINPSQNPNVPDSLNPTDLFTHTGEQVLSVSDLGYSYG